MAKNSGLPVPMTSLFRPDEHCMKCGCTLSAKTACLSCTCPLDEPKWREVASGEDDDLVKKEIGRPE